MKPLSAFGYFKLSRFSKPQCDRQVYQLIRKRRCHRLVEIGLGNGVRAEQMIAVAQKYADHPVRYTGIDLFEARDQGQPLPLKQMHRRLRPTGVRIQLVPGDFQNAIPRIANAHSETDLLLISASQRDLQSPAWSFVPRMLHDTSLVLVQPEAGGAFELWGPGDVPTVQPRSAAA